MTMAVMTMAAGAATLFGFVRGPRYRSLNLMLRLNQFMNAEMVREKTR